MPDSPERDWKTLAQLASTEQDPTKLLEIVEELNAALLTRERAQSGKSILKRVLLVDDDANLGLTLLPVLNGSASRREWRAQCRTRSRSSTMAAWKF
jgi:hypothetical protein